MNSKIWKVKGREETYTDKQLIDMIKSGELTRNDSVTTHEIREWIKLKKSIYQFYFHEEEEKK